MKSSFHTINIQDGLEAGKKLLKQEANAIIRLQDILGKEFTQLLEMIIESKGRIIITGVGKSGLVGKKIAATLSSLGTPAFFVHAGEALHGDLGMITADDILIAISNSGETEEVLKLLPSISRIGASLVALTGEGPSTLAQYADICLFTGVQKEACPHGLAPTTSSTTTLALGDALAVALARVRGFTSDDYALYHPGGSLGRKLLTKVSDVLKVRSQNPVVKETTRVQDALFKMTDSKMGASSVVNAKGKLVGIITDGDIRRLLNKSTDFLHEPIQAHMTKNPVTIGQDKLATEALKIMEKKEINDLPVVEAGKPVGLLNFQDLLRAKVF